MMRVAGWRCLVCGAERAVAEPFPWRCPAATASDRHHVLSIVDLDGTGEPISAGSGPQGGKDPAGVAAAERVVDVGAAGVAVGAANPFVTYDTDLAWAAYAAAHGMVGGERAALVGGLDDALASIGSVGFVPTPLARSAALSDALGFADGGGVWVKDQTGDVAGSHKARHLASILLHLLAAERLGHLRERPPLAIASCGNAALAAATLAAASRWPIDVYVPTWMNPAFGDEMVRLGARIHVSERRADDLPGDPAMLRFREAVAAGAIPFSVQGPENALALDGGRTIGWEIVDGSGSAGLDRVDRVYVQVGGGALAASVGRALADRGVDRLCTVEAEGCAPLARAWELAGHDLEDGPGALGVRWSELMTPWLDPRSVADGMLDDEVYDWLGIVESVTACGSSPVVATEADVIAAHQLATAAGFDVSPTGSAGLAGVLASVDAILPSERVVVIMTGASRPR